MSQTFFWYDFETYGIDPARDWPAQFAGIRTDANFQEIGEPVNIYCKLPPDQLPSPEACLVTHITPDEANQKGFCEADFIRQINEQFSRPNTCVLGYNSIRFDDEVTRHSLYRNFFDPYAREWQNGCSRWDLVDLVRLCAALRPEGIVWPRNEDGTNSLKLDQLTVANGIAHEQAHDALSDVRATIAMAKLVRERQPKLFDYVLNNRLKVQVARQLDVMTGSPKPVIHISGMYSSARHCLGVVAPLAAHPVNKNEIAVYDLSVDPTEFLGLSSVEMQYRMFTSSEELNKRGMTRLPIKTIHINKAPVVVPLGTFRKEDQLRLNFDMGACERHYDLLFADNKKLRELRKKLAEVFAPREREAVDDPDLMLYRGGFFSRNDRSLMDRLRSTPPQDLGSQMLPFEDGRLEEMLFRYRARNWPEFLNAEEQNLWREHCRQRIMKGVGGRSLGYNDYQAHLQEMISEETDDSRRQVLLKVHAYTEALPK